MIVLAQDMAAGLAASADDFSNTEDCAVAEASIGAGAEGWTSFPLDATLDAPYAWVWLEPEDGIEWRLMSTSLPGMLRAYAGPAADGPDAWNPSNGFYACALEPAAMAAFDFAPGNVTNGVARIVGGATNRWQPDPEEALPQWVELAFPEPTTFNTVQVTFVTDLNARSQDQLRRGVYAYSIEAGENGSWRTLLSETNNIQRWRRHVFAETTARRVRVVLRGANPDGAAGVYEVRVYHE